MWRRGLSLDIVSFTSLVERRREGSCLRIRLRYKSARPGKPNTGALVLVVHGRTGLVLAVEWAHLGQRMERAALNLRLSPGELLLQQLLILTLDAGLFGLLILVIFCFFGLLFLSCLK